MTGYAELGSAVFEAMKRAPLTIFPNLLLPEEIFNADQKCI